MRKKLRVTIGAVLILLTHNVFALTSLEQFMVANNIPLDTPITVYNVNDEIPIGITLTAAQMPDYERIRAEYLASMASSETSGTFNLLKQNENLLITSQITLNNVNVGEENVRISDGTVLNGRFTVENPLQVSQSVSIILSTYTADGKLNQLVTKETTVNANSSEILNIDYQFEASCESYGKIMFWNSAQCMIPLRATIDFNQKNGVNAYYYNSDNRLIQIDKSNGKTLVFTYDNMGNLLSKELRGAN